MTFKSLTPKQKSSLSAQIGKLIAEEAPTIDYTLDELATERESFSEDDLLEMAELGLYDGDFEKFYVIRQFLSDIGLPRVADDEYISDLFSLSRRLDAKAFEADPYMEILSHLPAKSGDFVLAPSFYRRGEIFGYDMPYRDGDGSLIIRLGFFNRTVCFPTLYEGERPWMSVCPSEINSMAKDIADAHGNVLVLGLGLGYYAYRVAQDPAVSSVTVVELSPDVVRLFEAYIAPHLDFHGKLKLVSCDAYRYLDSLAGKPYLFDYCFADIWEGAVDGAAHYKRLLPYEKALPLTEFRYWIEDMILAYTEEENEK